MRKEKAEKEAQWLQSLDDDQWHGLPHEVKERIIQQSVEKLRQKKLRYRPPLGQVKTSSSASFYAFCRAYFA